MNKTRKELIEIINRQLLATKPPFLRNSVYFSVSEATDLLRELEDDSGCVNGCNQTPLITSDGYCKVCGVKQPQPPKTEK